MPSKTLTTQLRQLEQKHNLQKSETLIKRLQTVTI